MAGIPVRFSNPTWQFLFHVAPRGAHLLDGGEWGCRVLQVSKPSLHL